MTECNHVWAIYDSLFKRVCHDCGKVEYYTEEAREAEEKRQLEKATFNNN